MKVIEKSFFHELRYTKWYMNISVYLRYTKKNALYQFIGTFFFVVIQGIQMVNLSIYQKKGDNK